MRRARSILRGEGRDSDNKTAWKAPLVIDTAPHTQSNSFVVPYAMGQKLSARRRSSGVAAAPVPAPQTQVFYNICIIFGIIPHISFLLFGQAPSFKIQPIAKNKVTAIILSRIVMGVPYSILINLPNFCSKAPISVFHKHSSSPASNGRLYRTF